MCQQKSASIWGEITLWAISAGVHSSAANSLPETSSDNESSFASAPANCTFTYNDIGPSEILTVINKIEIKKAKECDSISASTIKENCLSLLSVLVEFINQTVRSFANPDRSDTASDKPLIEKRQPNLYA